MNKIALCIGVDFVGRMEPLHKAADSARMFSEWASKQGYDTALFVDSSTTKIRRREILDRLVEVIDSKTYEQLIIFFSGHGVLRTLQNEVWLLSEADFDGTEMIDVTGTIDMARRSGIPHVLIVSDACRTISRDFTFNLGQGNIFPTQIPRSNTSVVDVMYGCRPGTPALELREDEWYGVFSDTLINVLNGKYPHLAKESIDKPKYWYISGFELKNTLPRIVQERVQDFDPTLDQEPEIFVEYSDPKPPISKFNKLPGISGGSSGGPPPPSGTNPDFKWNQEFIEKFKYISVQEILDKLGTSIGNNDYIDMTTRMYEMLDKIKYTGKIDYKLSKWSSYESFKCRFVVQGISVKYVLILGQQNWLIHGVTDKTGRITKLDVPKMADSSNALLILENGCSIPLAVLSGYVGTLVFKEDQLHTLNYTPSEGNADAYLTYNQNKDRIDRARSFVAYAANEGFNYSKVFSNFFNQDNDNLYSDAGSFLRIGKSIDPSLALYASYAFRQEGKLDRISSVLSYLRNDNNPIIFDIAMLGNELGEHKIASYCPLMTAGWSYQHLFNDHVRSEFMEASQFLDSGVWTMFKPEGTDILRRNIKI